VLGHHGGAPARFATAKGVIRRRGSSNRVAVATVTALRDSGGGMLPVRSCGAPGRGEGGRGEGGVRCAPSVTRHLLVPIGNRTRSAQG
jgi:hypothetical protein